MKKKNKKKNIIHKYWIVALLVLSLVLFLWLNSLNQVLLWDENVYLGNARSHIKQSYFIEDFRCPLLEYIIAGVWLIIGESVFIAKLTIIFFNLGSIFVFYLISKRLFKQAFLPTILFALSSEFVYWGFRVYGDSVAVFFILLSLYLFIKEKNILYILSGLFAAFSFLSRFPLALFAISIGIYCLIKRKWKPLILFSIGFVIGILPWLIYNMIIYKNPLWDVFALYSAVEQYTCAQPAWLLLGYIVQNLSILILFLPTGIIGIINKRKKKEFDFWIIIIIYLIISFIYYLFFVKQKVSRYVLVFIPFLILICYHGILELLKIVRIKKVLKIIIIILIISLMLVPLKVRIDDIRKNWGCNKAVNEALNYVKENTNPGDTILGNEWIGYGYHGNLKAFSLWDPDISMLVEFYKPVYVIYHTKGGIEYNLTTLEQSKDLNLEKTFKGKCFDIKIFKAIRSSK